MSCQSNNATAPGPAIAPGSESIDPAQVAKDLARRGMDPRITRLVPSFDAPFFQAGLAGYSDAAMRIIARRHGCPFCVTEALLDRALLAGGKGFDKADLGELHDNVPGGAEDHPLACQIMGSEPDEIAASAVKVAEQGRKGEKHYRRLAYSRTSPFHGVEFPHTQQHPAIVTDHVFPADETLPAFEVIDINLACPVKKIRAKARGGHWLAEPDGAIDLLKAVRKAVPSDVPCTVKLRRSFDDTPEMAANFERIFNAAYEMGYAWTTVHARTVEQKYIGPSRWPVLRDLVARYPDRPIFGSGDIWDVNDIFRMIAYTGVTAVSVARGCIGNPWIFRQAREMLSGRTPSAPSVAEQRRVLEDHFQLAVTVQGEDNASRTMRKFGIRFAAHHPHGELIRKRFIAVESLPDWQQVLADHYSTA